LDSVAEGGVVVVDTPCSGVTVVDRDGALAVKGVEGGGRGVLSTEGFIERRSRVAI
jgi:hypothetical protein